MAGIYTIYTEAPKIQVDLQTVKTSSTWYWVGRYYCTFTETVTTEKFKYCFLSQAAAAACVSAMQTAYTNTFTEPSVVCGSDGVPYTTNGTKTELEADIDAQRAYNCEAYDVTISVHTTRHEMSGWTLAAKNPNEGS